jgi:hypothetical protein
MSTRHHIKMVAMMALWSLPALCAQPDSLSSPELKKNSVGLGFGIPYGILGGNLDINVAPNLDLSAGIGAAASAGVGYSFGLKYFFTPIERTFRPRISAYYGTNTAVEATTITFYSSSTEKKTYSGLNLGLGAQFMWGETKSNGLDFDIIYIATTGLDLEEWRDRGFTVEEPGKVKFSIGYRHGF